MRGLDAWLATEPWEDAPLHDRCSQCQARTMDYHQQVAGLCREHLEREQEMDAADELLQRAHEIEEAA